MINAQIMQKIRNITIRTRRLMQTISIGDNRSVQKGIGFEFNTMREYQEGDDIRFIDWHASSRHNNLLVREYIEERNKNIIIALDVSASSFFGSQEQEKKEVIAEIGSVLALIAQQNRDCVGILFFSDKIEKYIPLKRGASHTFAIMKALYELKESSSATDSYQAFRFLLQLKKKNALLFLVSDCIDKYQESYLMQVARMYEMIVIRTLDQQERTFPSVGFLHIRDIETGEICFIHSAALKKQIEERIVRQNEFFSKKGIRLLEINNQRDWVERLVQFFKFYVR